MTLRCPVCHTELDAIKRSLWCWRCETFLRPGVARAARLAAQKANDPPAANQSGSFDTNSEKEVEG